VVYAGDTGRGDFRSEQEERLSYWGEGIPEIDSKERAKAENPFK
jgi:hypothetical protein